MTATVRGAALVAMLWASVALGQRLRATASPSPAVASCSPAVMVDGLLMCGAEARSRCAGLRSGDVLSGPDCVWRGRMPPAELLALGVPIELNLASPEELAGLPGIGPVLAARIVAARPFVSVEDLEQVRGIGPVRMTMLRPLVGVLPPG